MHTDAARTRLRVSIDRDDSPYRSETLLMMAPNKNSVMAGTTRAATIACGATFIVLHAIEWSRLHKETWSEPLFGATFFTITGLHMLHVAVGVIYLTIVGSGVLRDKFTAEDVEVSGLYWHFVDVVWMFIFPLVYLTSVSGGAG